MTLATPLCAAAPECSATTPDACRYPPAARPRYAAAPEEIVALEYADVTGATRRFSIALRRPAGAPEPLPIVLWSHGGARGQNDASAVGTRWSEVFTGAGYLVVAIAHHERDRTSRLTLCNALGFDVQACETFKFLSWDRPHDVRRVLDWLDEQAAAVAGAEESARRSTESSTVEGGPAARATLPSLAGRIDPRRVAYAGHSAGAGSTLMMAGASRDFAGSTRTLSDPRPVAFIGCSPQGIGHDGFGATSFDAIDRPYLVLSGAGDATEGHDAAARRDAFDRMKPGHAYLGWIADPTTRHVTFDLESRACVRAGGSESRCAAHLDWLGSAALAFLDAYVRGDAAARAYLGSGHLRVLSGGAFEWSHR